MTSTRSAGPDVAGRGRFATTQWILPEMRMPSDRMRALCDDIARQAGALTEPRIAVAYEADHMPTVDRTPKGS